MRTITIRQSNISEQNSNWSNYSKIICCIYSYYLNLNFKTKKQFVQKLLLNILLFLFFQNHLFYSKIFEKFCSNCFNCYFDPKFYFALQFLFKKK